MGSEMKVRVRVEALRSRVAEAVEKAEKELATEQATHAKLEGDYNEAVVVALKSALAKAEKGSPPNRCRYNDGVYVPVPCPIPSEPSDRTLKAAKADLALLEMASDEVMAIGHNDRFSEYLK